ncbi:MAG: phage holin family protein [Bacteroidetes bacterium]|nr:phage holin family protein [Bacteroidota bacterium]
MKFFLKLITESLAVIAACYLLPHVHVDSPLHAILFAVVMTALNMLVKPALILFTLPATIFTFGLFLLVINAALVLIADYLLDGFKVDGFWWAMLFSIVISIINAVLERLARDSERK